MRRYILKRLLQLIPVLLGVTFLSFAMMRLAGSDAITEMYGEKGAVSQEIIDAKRAELGLDRPFLSQYFSWLGGLLTGDMGTSYVSGRDVFGTFVSKLPATLLLTALSVAATVLLSVPLGILAAVRHDRFTDYFLRFCSFIGNALPNFFVALLLMQVFSIRWRLLPVLSEGTSLRSAVLPTLTLAIAMSAKYMRQVRAAVLEELNRAAARSLTRQQAAEMAGRRMLSQKELSDRLVKKGTDPQEAQETARWLADLGAVDDAAYAGVIVRHYAAMGYGPGRVRQELQRRGIPQELWDDALALLPEGEEAIERFIRSKCKGKPLDRETQRKLAAALQRRGFSWQEIRPVLNRLGEEMAEE